MLAKPNAGRVEARAVLVAGVGVGSPKVQNCFPVGVSISVSCTGVPKSGYSRGANGAVRSDKNAVLTAMGKEKEK